jgi:hypothetical protein
LEYTLNFEPEKLIDDNEDENASDSTQATMKETVSS